MRVLLLVYSQGLISLPFFFFFLNRLAYFDTDICIHTHHRTRTPPTKPARVRDIDECNLHGALLRSAIGGDPAVVMVPVPIDDQVHGVTVSTQHHLVDLQRVYNVHGARFDTFGIFVRLGGNHRTPPSTATAAEHVPDCVLTNFRRKPTQPVPPLSQRFHQCRATPFLLGLLLEDGRA